jgi:hypothetical protein
VEEGYQEVVQEVGSIAGSFYARMVWLYSITWLTLYRGITAKRPLHAGLAFGYD